MNQRKLPAIVKIWNQWNGYQSDHFRSIRYKLPDKIVAIGKLREIWYIANKPLKVDPEDGGKETLYHHEFRENYLPWLCTDANGRMLFIVFNFHLHTGWIDTKLDRQNGKRTAWADEIVVDEQPVVFARLGVIDSLKYYDHKNRIHRILWKQDSVYHPIMMCDQDANILYGYGNFRVENHVVKPSDDFEDAAFYSSKELGVENPNVGAGLKPAPTLSTPTPTLSTLAENPADGGEGDIHGGHIRLADLVIDPKLQPRSKLVDRPHVDALKKHFDLSKLVTSPIQITDGNKVISGFHRSTALTELMAENKPVFWGDSPEEIYLTGEREIPITYIPPRLAKEASIESNLGVMGFTPYELGILFKDQKAQGLTEKEIGQKYGGRKSSEVKALIGLTNLKSALVLEGLRENIFDANMLQKLQTIGKYNLPVETEVSAWNLINNAEKPVSLENLRRHLEIQSQLGTTKKDTEDNEPLMFEVEPQGVKIQDYLKKESRLRTDINKDIKALTHILKDPETLQFSKRHAEFNLMAAKNMLMHLDFLGVQQESERVKIPEGIDPKMLDDLKFILSGEHDYKTMLKTLQKDFVEDEKVLDKEIMEPDLTSLERDKLIEEKRQLEAQITTLKEQIKQKPAKPIQEINLPVPKQHDYPLESVEEIKSRRGSLRDKLEGLPLPQKTLVGLEEIAPKSKPQHAFGFDIPLDIDLYATYGRKRGDKILQSLFPQLKGEQNEAKRRAILDRAEG